MPGLSCSESMDTLRFEPKDFRVRGGCDTNNHVPLDSLECHTVQRAGQQRETYTCSPKFKIFSKYHFSFMCLSCGPKLKTYFKLSFLIFCSKSQPKIYKISQNPISMFSKLLVFIYHHIRFSFLSPSFCHLSAHSCFPFVSTFVFIHVLAYSFSS